jgi:hypothetical protein
MSTPDRELQPADALRAEQEAELEAERDVERDVPHGVDREVEQDADVDLDDDARVDPAAEPDDGSEEPELAIALSPRQILGGFALLAAIIIWLFRRRKG